MRGRVRLCTFVDLLFEKWGREGDLCWLGVWELLRAHLRIVGLRCLLAMPAACTGWLAQLARL